MRRAIVTGGNGFIGSSLIEFLTSEGVEVHAIVNDNHQRLDAILPPENIHELRDGFESAVRIVTDVKPDTIFHLAAVYAEPVTPEAVLSMINGNLTLGACLLFAATQLDPQPVFINTGSYWQFDTSARYSPNTLYAATKHAFQDLLHFYRERQGVTSTSLMLYDTFGEKDTRAKLWRLLTTAAAGETVRLSPGEQIIHLVHVDDAVAAFIRAAQLLHAGSQMKPLYSVCSMNPVGLRTFVERLNSEGGLGLNLQWGAVPYWEGQVLEPWVGDTLPGWSPQVEVLPELLRMAAASRASHTASPICAP